VAIEMPLMEIHFSLHSNPQGLNPNSGKEMQSSIHLGTLMGKNTNSTTTKNESPDPGHLGVKTEFLIMWKLPMIVETQRKYTHHLT